MSTDGRFRSRVVIVTGAGSGIGAATALQFGAEGAQVTCVDVDEAAATATANAITDADGAARAAACDVSDEASVRAVVNAAVEAGGRLDVVANVAGVGGFRRFEDLGLAEWNRMIGVNLTGTYLMCHEAIGHLLESKGAIVNVSSTAGLKGQPWSSAYCASKGGVALFTRALAHEFAERGVRVNAVAPGGVNTPLIKDFAFPEGVDLNMSWKMVPATGEMAEPADIAEAICWLASDEARYVHGAVLPVDGCTVA
ncbi:MAG: SDR family oxidoreductase [Acidimicrobiia bacterium]|nr:SDR family oxidoreductase [Acidimicrobiia bacterium]